MLVRARLGLVLKKLRFFFGNEEGDNMERHFSEYRLEFLL